jgi:hypothetical protein
MEMAPGRGADVVAEKQRRSTYDYRGVGTRELKQHPPLKQFLSSMTGWAYGTIV